MSVFFRLCPIDSHTCTLRECRTAALEDDQCPKAGFSCHEMENNYHEAMSSRKDMDTSTGNVFSKEDIEKMKGHRPVGHRPLGPIDQRHHNQHGRTAPDYFHKQAQTPGSVPDYFNQNVDDVCLKRGLLYNFTEAGKDIAWFTLD